MRNYLKRAKKIVPQIEITNILSPTKTITTMSNPKMEQFNMTILKIFKLVRKNEIKLKTDGAVCIST